MRWGQGSLQEIDHVPFVRPLTKLAATAQAATEEIPGLIDDALVDRAAPALRPDVRRLAARRRLHPRRAEPETAAGAAGARSTSRRRATALERAVALLREAERPVIMAGTDL